MHQAGGFKMQDDFISDLGVVTSSLYELAYRLLGNATGLEESSDLKQHDLTPISCELFLMAYDLHHVSDRVVRKLNELEARC
jgi:hypothetical protein